MELKKIKMNRKGIADVKLWIPIVILMVMVSIFMVGLYHNIATSRALASAQTTSKELGFEIDAAYAAPESVELIHAVSLTDAMPATGTVLINHGSRRICTSTYSEDEMWAYILNSGITGYVGGKVQKAMWNNREGVKKALYAAKIAWQNKNPLKWKKLFKSGIAARGAAKVASAAAKGDALYSELSKTAEGRAADANALKSSRKAYADALKAGKSGKQAGKAAFKAQENSLRKSTAGKKALKNAKHIGKEKGRSEWVKTMKKELKSKPGAIKGWTKGKLGAAKKVIVNAFKKAGTAAAKRVLGKKFTKVAAGTGKVAGVVGKAVKSIRSAVGKVLGSTLDILMGNYWGLMSKLLLKMYASITKDEATGAVQTVLESLPPIPIPVPPFALPIGRIISYGLYYTAQAINFMISYWPLYKTIDAGQGASTEMLESVKCFNYVSDNKKMNVGPPNCESEVIRLPVDLTAIAIPIKLPIIGDLGEISIGWAFTLLGVTTFLPGDFDASKPKLMPASKSTQEVASPPDKVAYDVNEQCLDAPNALIAYENTIADVVKKVLTGPATIFSAITGNFESGRTTDMEAKYLIMGPRAVCTYLSIVSPSRGTKCNSIWTKVLIGFMLGWPEQYFTTLWGPNILPASENHYMSLPLAISVDKTYNPVTGQSNMTVRKEL